MFLRSVSRAAGATRRSSTLSMPTIRSYSPSSKPVLCQKARSQREKTSFAVQQTRAATEHAIANPTLAGIEKRWESMPPQEQADLWMQLRDRMKVDWHELTLQEKKAAYWIAFGSHGPRAESPKGEGWKIFTKVTQLFIASMIIFGITRFFARPPPRTMTKEWQEATNEYALKEKLEPLSGISSEGYEGKGFVQSRSSTKS